MPSSFNNDLRFNTSKFLRTVEDVDSERLKEAFVQRRNSPDDFAAYPTEIQAFIQNILGNMIKRYRYSERNALDTIIFAFRKDIIKFEEIISSEASD